MEIFILLKVIFLLLIINLSESAQWITWEEALEAAGEDDQGVGGGGCGGGEPPVSLNLTSVSCPCNKLLLSSLGPAATVLPQVMGTYTR